MLRECRTYDINGSFGLAEKTLSINFSKSNRKCCLILHYNADDNSYFVVNGKEIFKFKAGNKNVNFLTQFCLGNISNGFSVTKSREVSLEGNVYDCSVDCSSINKSDILNIHKYLMIANDIEIYSTLLNKCLFY